MYVDIDVTLKENIIVGLLVDIVEEQNKSTQKITRGRVKRIISNSDCNRGIKVELTNGAIGHSKGVPNKNEIKKDNFRFYNLFFYQEYIYSIWDKKNNNFLVVNRENKINHKFEKSIFLFSSKEIAESKIKGTSLDNNNYLIRSIKRKNKPITIFFKNYDIDYFLIDNSKKINKIRFNELESQFKSF